MYLEEKIAPILLRFCSIHNELGDRFTVGEGENAGTAFNISGEYDRFFMLGKGQAREKDPEVIDYEEDHNVICGERVPFKQMFEQFSPTTGDKGSEITDFYDNITSIKNAYMGGMEKIVKK